jgi:hypothetical protein
VVQLRPARAVEWEHGPYKNLHSRGRTNKLTGPAATPVTHTDDRRAMGNKSVGRVRCSDGIHLMAALVTGRTCRQVKKGSPVEPVPSVDLSGGTEVPPTTKRVRPARHLRGHARRLYKIQHSYYCGVDRHARSLFVNILDDSSEPRRAVWHRLGCATGVSRSRDEMPTKEPSRCSRVIFQCAIVSLWCFEVRRSGRSGRPRRLVFSQVGGP